ncbi:hypothetical protein CY0110_18127 [Crocosphaera chwakensis CCY0110]|uniref:Uncharacterized protein n=1 Tax=Crocosphaera chwakensis CCY0110 TaxID=391612 RepID=A3IIV7_9CHRO|nr:hypothetical protein CY0110_18127 [Crocosphaera chwakensis CCY0110]
MSDLLIIINLRCRLITKKLLFLRIYQSCYLMGNFKVICYKESLLLFF